jgi:hypothetical protein
VVSQGPEENMEKKSTLGGHGQTGVNSLTTGDLHEASLGESMRPLAGATDAVETVSSSASTFDGMPARRIQLRYWAMLLVIGALMWAAILFGLL